MNRLRITFFWPTATLLLGLVLATCWVIVVSGSTDSARLQAQPKPPTAKAATADILTETEIIERVTGSLDRSVKYLSGVQIRDGSPMDGAWDDCNAPNAMAILSIMGRGHVPGRGPYADVLERGKKYLLRTQEPSGLFRSKRIPGSGPMYSHGLTTLCMAEMYGMDADPELEEKLRKAVDLIVRCQSAAGGWRYQPNPSSQDVSVTVMQVVALRAANNAEVPVPQTTIDNAVKYIKQCAHPKGGFGYTGPARGPHTTAAGILSLQLLGHYNDPTVTSSLEYMSKIPVTWGRSRGVTYFYYFHYYAIQGNYQAGGKYWNQWHPQVREMFLERQNENGSWGMPAGMSETASVVGRNNVYWTAMASLVLEVYMHYLPAYQR